MPLVLVMADSMSCVLRIAWQLMRTTISPGRTPIRAAGESERTESTANPLSDGLPPAPNHDASFVVAACGEDVGAVGWDAGETDGQGGA